MKKQKPKKFTAESEFPRRWKHSMEGGLVYEFITQPYITGLYIAGKCTPNGSQVQLSQQWESFDRFVKRLKQNKDITELEMQPLGMYLSEDDLPYLP